MSLQSNYFWMRSRAGEVMLGRHWCDTLELREAGGLWELELGPWYTFLTFAWFKCCLSPVSVGAAGRVGMGSRESSASVPTSHGHPWVLVLLVQGEVGFAWGLPRTSPGQREMETTSLWLYRGPALPGSEIPGEVCESLFVL